MTPGFTLGTVASAYHQPSGVLNKLFTWGAAANGRLGNGTTSPDVTSPAQIGSDTDWDKIAVGQTHTLAIKDGKLFTWGAAANGRLGNGTTSPDVTSPAQIGSDTDWTNVAAGGDLSLGIRDGKLFSWGSNATGRTGQGTTSGDTTTPTQVGSDTGWTVVSAGGLNQGMGAGIRDGKLFTWGAKNSGQLGDGTTSGTTTTPTQVGSDTDWTLVAVGFPTSTMVGGHCLAIKGGKLFSWGNALNGKLGNGTTTPNVSSPAQIGSNTDWTDVAAGTRHSLGIRDGKLFSWGAAANGRLGNGTTTPDVTSPAQIGSDTDWTAISAGNAHSLGIRGSKLFSWGEGNNGKLGNGTTGPNVTSPAQVGSDLNWISIAKGASANHCAGIKG